MSEPARWLAEAQARVDAATPGPWGVGLDGILGDLMHYDEQGTPVATVIVATEHGQALRDPNAHFIAAARTDLPAALDALRRALAVADSLSSGPGITDRATVGAHLRHEIQTALFPDRSTP